MGGSACAGRAQSAQILLTSWNRPQTSSVDSQQACESFARVRSAKKVSGISLTLGGRQRMRSQGHRLPKLYWLARIGPKKVFQTRKKPASHLRALHRQKRIVGIFVNPRWKVARVQAGPQKAKILLTCLNRPPKKFCRLTATLRVICAR